MPQAKLLFRSSIWVAISPCRPGLKTAVPSASVRAPARNVANTASWPGFPTLSPAVSSAAASRAYAIMRKPVTASPTETATVRR